MTAPTRVTINHDLDQALRLPNSTVACAVKKSTNPIMMPIVPPQENSGSVEIHRIHARAMTPSMRPANIPQGIIREGFIRPDQRRILVSTSTAFTPLIRPLPDSYYRPDNGHTAARVVHWNSTADDNASRPDNSTQFGSNYVVTMQVNGYEIGPGAHLHNANLNNADLSNANLSGADLIHANLRKANLTHANLSNANLSNANLAKAKLSKAQLSGANLSKAHLHQANLTNAHLSGANLTGADITGANLTGADLSGTTMPNGKVHKITHE